MTRFYVMLCPRQSRVGPMLQSVAKYYWILSSKPAGEGGEQELNQSVQKRRKRAK